MPGRERLETQNGKFFEGERYPLQCFKKVWYEWFFAHHDLHGKDDIAAAEAKKSLGCVEDPLTSFLDVCDSWGSPCESDEVRWRCEGGPSLEEVQGGIGEYGLRRSAWIDDRNSPHLRGTGHARLYDSRVSSTSLLKHLKQPV